MDGARHILQNKFLEKRAEKGTALMIPILLGLVALTLGIELYFCIVHAVLHTPSNLPIRRHLPKFWTLSPFAFEWACSQHPQLTPTLGRNSLPLQESLVKICLLGIFEAGSRTMGGHVFTLRMNDQPGEG